MPELFDALLQESTRLYQEQQRLREQRRGVHARLGDKIRQVVDAYIARFEPLVDDLSEREIQTISPGDVLSYWTMESDMLLATFEYSFRGCVNDYTVRVPLAYFGDEGAQRLEADARAHEQALAQEAQRQAESRAQQEHQQYLELKRKFESSGAATGSPTDD